MKKEVKKKMGKKYGIIDKDISVKHAKTQGIKNFLLKGRGDTKMFYSKDAAENYRIRNGLKRGKVITIFEKDLLTEKEKQKIRKMDNDWTSYMRLSKEDLLGIYERSQRVSGRDEHISKSTIVAIIMERQYGKDLELLEKFG